MEEQRQLANTFYNAFKHSDFQTMQKCYHRDIKFSDPLFNINGLKAHAMWHMLLENAADPNSRTFTIGQVDSSTVTVNWEAKYTFSKTGNKVHNKVKATLTISQGKIITHHDYFDLYQWAKMALGFKAVLLGWTPFFQQKIRDKANQRLTTFIKKHPQYS